MMAGLILASEGWTDTNLGPDLTVESFAEAIRVYHPSLIWISFNVVEAGRKFTQKWKPFLRDAEKAEVQIIVGGRAFPEEAAAESACITHLSSMEDFARWLQAGSQEIRLAL